MLVTGELACYISLEPIDSCETLYYDRVNISKYNNYLRPNLKKYNFIHLESKIYSIKTAKYGKAYSLVSLQS